MAKYQHIGIDDMSFTSDEDLTAKQYRFVIPASTAGKVMIANGASNPTPLGVLQNSPSAGQEARVRVIGPTKLEVVNASGCGLAYGRFVTSSSVGQGISQASENVVVLGRWLDTAVALSACAIGQAFINCAGFATCAPSAC
jgi:hypothetical protein